MRTLFSAIAALIGLAGCHSFDEVSICDEDPEKSIGCPGNASYCVPGERRCNGNLIERCDGVPGRWGLEATCQVACSAATCVHAVDLIGADDGACAVFDDGTVRCWGANYSGQLGDGTTQLARGPVVVNFLRGARSIAMGLGHSCAVLFDGAVSCWGGNASGQLGDGTQVSHLAPATVVLPGEAIQTAVTIDASCALTKAGQVYCWGAGGVLGVSGIVSSPQLVNGVEPMATVLTAAGHGFCSLAGETVQCWGMGVPDSPISPATTPPTKVQGAFKSLTAFARLACAKTTDDRLMCWGANPALSEVGSLAKPYEASDWMAARAVSLGGDHICGLTPGGGAMCAGSNRYGQLCRNSTVDSLTPGPMQGAPMITKLVSAVASNCMLTIGGSVYCCGKTDEGAGGPNPDGGNNLLPTPVSF